MTRLEIDVYSDFVCPWCFIGWRRLQAALESFGHGRRDASSSVPALSGRVS
jgi:predicted DsbA family dithiol-disulfide isomerase